MIAWLSGTLRARDEGELVVDVGGVGYLVRVPLSVAADVAEGEDLELHVYTHVREDQLALYGFETTEQKAVFNTLLGISKVGPKLAVNIMGGITPSELAAAVDAGDVARLTLLSGVGKRLAERLTVELRGKLDAVATGPAGVSKIAPRAKESQTWRDLRSALANLQYRRKEIDSVVDQLQREQPEDAAFDALLRAALGHLKKS